MKNIKLVDTHEGQRYNLNEIQRMLLSEEVDYNSNCEINSQTEYDQGRSFIQLWDNKFVVMLVCESTEENNPVLFRLVFKTKVK